jgi:hypothetical protein
MNNSQAPKGAMDYSVMKSEINKFNVKYKKERQNA